MPERPTVSAPEAGALLGGRYRLDRPLGHGGMAQVWAAVDTVLGRRVAVKVLHPHLRDDPAFVRRFHDEARRSARLSDPGIVAVYDHVSDGAVDAIVLELVDGGSLHDLLAQRRTLPPSEVVRIGADVARALDAAHRQGIVHRDVTTANIMCCSDGAVKVADFGLAKADGDLDVTVEGTVVGTASYLAPEQLRGEQLDGRADVFALGIVLYQALCGRLPFTGATDAERLSARLHQRPPSPRQLVPSVPRPLSDAIMRALEREPAQRFGSAAEFRAALLDSLDGGGRAPAPPRTPTVGVATVAAPTVGAPEVVVRRGTTAARPVAHSPRRRRRRPRRNWVGIAILTALIGGATLLVIALVWTGLPSTGRSGPTTAARGIPATPQRIASVRSFDPFGTGTQGENDAALPNLVDDDPTTAWTTERYNQRDFGTKAGVGVTLRLASATRVDRLRITSPTRGWSVAVYLVPDGEPVTTLPAAAVVERTGVTGDLAVDLGGRTASQIVVWITDLGEGSRGFQVALTDATVWGRPE